MLRLCILGTVRVVLLTRLIAFYGGVAHFGCADSCALSLNQDLHLLHPCEYAHELSRIIFGADMVIS